MGSIHYKTEAQQSAKIQEISELLKIGDVETVHVHIQERTKSVFFNSRHRKRVQLERRYLAIVLKDKWIKERSDEVAKLMVDAKGFVDPEGGLWVNSI